MSRSAQANFAQAGMRRVLFGADALAARAQTLAFIPRSNLLEVRWPCSQGLSDGSFGVAAGQAASPPLMGAVANLTVTSESGSSDGIGQVR
jgi:hypothetical protein